MSALPLQVTVLYGIQVNYVNAIILHLCTGFRKLLDKKAGKVYTLNMGKVIKKKVVRKRPGKSRLTTWVVFVVFTLGLLGGFAAGYLCLPSQPPKIIIFDSCEAAQAPKAPARTI